MKRPATKEQTNRLCAWLSQAINPPFDHMIHEISYIDRGWVVSSDKKYLYILNQEGTHAFGPYFINASVHLKNDQTIILVDDKEYFVLSNTLKRSAFSQENPLTTLQ